MNSTAKKIQFFENNNILIVQSIKNIFLCFNDIYAKRF